MGGLLFVVVENMRDRPAHNVRIKFDRPFSGMPSATRS
jgi:hypothetical protein